LTRPYWQGDGITLYHGDCREVLDWLDADVLVTDPPYGRKYSPAPGNGTGGKFHMGRGASGITGDEDTTTRDAALATWGGKLAIVFGDLTLPPPPGIKLTMVYRKPDTAGAFGAMGGFRRDAEAIYLLGPWTAGIGGKSSVLSSQSREFSLRIAQRYGHPHAKPVDVMETLIAACPPGVIADPFAGSGSTLVAARNQGRRAVGVEIDERYCEMAARRLDQGILAPAEEVG
jgi:site-specific DNA-methyltransferase (adenine-specific)